MRACLLAFLCSAAAAHLVAAEPEAYRIAVLADTDTTGGGWIATLIADELRRSKDVILIDEKSADLTVSCFVITVSGSGGHHPRFAASVALMLEQRQLVKHFPLTADSLKSLAHKVVVEVDRRELRGAAPRK